MTPTDLQAVVQSHLSDMSERVAVLCTEKKRAAAQAVNDRCLEIAAAYDNEEEFLVLGGLWGVARSIK